jgi:hypothetical protein
LSPSIKCRSVWIFFLFASIHKHKCISRRWNEEGKGKDRLPFPITSWASSWAGPYQAWWALFGSWTKWELWK